MSFPPDNLDWAPIPFPSREEDWIWKRGKEHRENCWDVRWGDVGKEGRRPLDKRVGESGLDLPRRRKKGADLV